MHVKCSPLGVGVGPAEVAVAELELHAEMPDKRQKERLKHFLCHRRTMDWVRPTSIGCEKQMLVNGARQGVRALGTGGVRDQAYGRLSPRA